MKMKTTNKKGITAVLKQYTEGNIKKSEAIRELFKNGMEVKSIAESLEIRYQHVYNTVQNAIYKQEIDSTNIVLKEKTSDKKNKITELLSQGKSPKEIAIELKSNINYVYKIKKELKG
jgi:DNA invertase Pin-like site-specific DNA recombinase